MVLALACQKVDTGRTACSRQMVCKITWKKTVSRHEDDSETSDDQVGDNGIDSYSTEETEQISLFPEYILQPSTFLNVYSFSPARFHCLANGIRKNEIDYAVNDCMSSLVATLALSSRSIDLICKRFLILQVSLICCAGAYSY